jgi:hypothetical protein
MAHKRMWEKRIEIYNAVNSDIGAIDYRLRGLLQGRPNGKQKSLPEPKKNLIEIEDLRA